MELLKIFGQYRDGEKKNNFDKIRINKVIILYFERKIVVAASSPQKAEGYKYHIYDFVSSL